MKIVISPAKTLDYQSNLPTTRHSRPLFQDTTALIARKMARMSRKELQKLMGFSDKLAVLNYERYREFQEEPGPEHARPAIYAFAGDVYTGLDAYSIPVVQLDRLQEILRILSGLYGILRPLDLIQPYRLEMGTPLKVGRKKDLYQIWREKVTLRLNEEVGEEDFLLNLASQEYFRAIDPDLLDVPVITPSFMDFRNGKLQTIALFAKKARGAMVRYILDNGIDNQEGLLGFDYMGYRFSPRHTEKGSCPVFTR